MTGGIPGLEREIGDMQARLRALERTQERIGEDLSAIRSAIDQAKGGRRALWFLLSASAALAGILSSAATYLTLR